MRFVLIALLLIGCGPGPKSARGDEPKPLTEAEFSKLQAELKGGEKKETYTAAVQRYETAVSGLAETVGNTNSELEGIKNELRALKGEVAEIRGLLSVEAEKPSYVPQVIVPEPPAEPSPVKADAPPAAASSDQRITFQGKPIDVNAWLKRSVTFVDIRGDVDAHLRDHGLEGDFSRFSRSQKLQLHSVAHSYGVPLKSTPARKIVVKAPAVVLPYSSNCPNGNCARQGMYGYSTRSRLFGWRR
jgi:hypothetical protein